MKILALNAGSSSQKSRLYEIDASLPKEPPAPLWEADADWTERQGVAEVKIKAGQGQQQALQENVPMDKRETIIKHMLATLWSGTTRVIEQPSEIDIVGHRVVHGGQEYRESTFVTPEVKAAIQRFAVFAPSTFVDFFGRPTWKASRLLNRCCHMCHKWPYSIQRFTATCLSLQQSTPVPMHGLSRAFVAMDFTASVMNTVHGVLLNSWDGTWNP